MKFEINSKYTEEQRRLIENIGRTWFALKQRGKDYLSKMDFNLSIEQCIVLFALSKKEGLTLGEIADKIDRDRTTLSRMVDNLENKNLVLRVNDKIDKRKKLLYLTPDGKNKITQVMLNTDFYFDGIYGNLDKDEIDSCNATLTKIFNNIE